MPGLEVVGRDLDADPTPRLESGLLEAQKAAVQRFAEAEGITLIAEYVEIETGKGADAGGPDG